MLDITAIQETHEFRKKSGKDFYIFCLSSGSQERHEFGTDFIVPKRTRKAFIDFQSIQKLLCKMRIQGQKFNISLINVDSPTEEKQEDEKNLPTRS